MIARRRHARRAVGHGVAARGPRRASCAAVNLGIRHDASRRAADTDSADDLHGRDCFQVFVLSCMPCQRKREALRNATDGSNGTRRRLQGFERIDRDALGHVSRHHMNHLTGMCPDTLRV